MEVVYLASSVLSLFYLLILAGKKTKKTSDYILIVWFVLLFSNVLSFYLIYKDRASSWLILLLNMSVFLHGPLLYFYTSALTGIPKRFSLKNAAHLLPFLVFLLVTCWLTAKGGRSLDVFNNGLVLLKFVLPSVYVMLSLKIIIRHRNRIEHFLSSTTRMELNWLAFILYGILVLIIFGAITMVLYYFTPLMIPDSGGRYLNVAFSVFIILLGYFGFRQTSIFIPASVREDHFVLDLSPLDYVPDKYSKSKLSADDLENIYMALIQHMKTTKPYIDKNLTLFKLADQLGISENKLSQVINSKSGINFFEFINEYRVKEVKSRMTQGEHIKSTLLGIAYDSGFNSKASFNRAFKKFTELTPSEYLKQKGY